MAFDNFGVSNNAKGFGWLFAGNAPDMGAIETVPAD